MLRSYIPPEGSVTEVGYEEPWLTTNLILSLDSHAAPRSRLDICGGP